ncbi:hypothetical protein JTB14_018481 [Gonioctena quinquepunctata]|nr:hypothetical protein JTB14_018481 [Gonioctena quinquepunctata]
MVGDNVSSVIRKDVLILTYGESEFQRLAHENRHYRNISDRIRGWEAAKKIDPSVNRLSQLINANKYQLIKNSVKLIAGSDETMADKYGFQELAEITLVRTLILNRRRVGEIQYMLLSDFIKAKSADPMFFKYQALLNRNSIIHIYFLYAPQPDIFVLLKKYANLAGCEFVDSITSTRLRKHIATMTQLLNLKDHELDSLAKFMGHDIRVHREYYRLSDETTQLAKISKLLISLDKGDFNRLKGKNLDGIDFVQDRDESESDFDEEDSHQEILVVPENNDPASNISDVNPPTEKTSIMSLPNERTIQNMKASRVVK